MYVDAHSHLDMYKSQLEAALAEIKSINIFTISVSMDLDSYEKNLTIGKSCDLILPAFGIHPWNAHRFSKNLEELSVIVQTCAMVGEIGLDHYFVKDVTRYPLQYMVFEHILSAAARHGKVVNLHTKGAEAEVLQLLQRFDPPGVIIHWYSGPLQAFRQLAARSCYFTIGHAVLTSRLIQQFARDIPLEQLLTETDNPYSRLGSRRTADPPGLIRSVVKKVAELRGMSTESLVEAVTANLTRLLQLDGNLNKFSALLSSESITHDGRQQMDSLPPTETR